MVDGCDVCIYMGDYDPAEFYSSTWPKARKPHKCCECRREIAPGEKYERTVGKWDGQMDTYLTCSECVEIRQQFCCDGWLYGDLWEQMQEQAFEHLKMAGPCWEGLSAKAKQHLLNQWNRWKF